MRQQAQKQIPRITGKVQVALPPTIVAPSLCPGTVEDALLRWLRAAELTCDRAALLVAQDSTVVIGALMKLAGGSPTFAHELSVDAFLQQVCSWVAPLFHVIGAFLTCFRAFAFVQYIVIAADVWVQECIGLYPSV